MSCLELNSRLSLPFGDLTEVQQQTINQNEKFMSPISNGSVRTSIGFVNSTINSNSGNNTNTQEEFAEKPSTCMVSFKYSKPKYLDLIKKDVPTQSNLSQNSDNLNVNRIKYFEPKTISPTEIVDRKSRRSTSRTLQSDFNIEKLKRKKKRKSAKLEDNNSPTCANTSSTGIIETSAERNMKTCSYCHTKKGKTKIQGRNIQAYGSVCNSCGLYWGRCNKFFKSGQRTDEFFSWKERNNTQRVRKMKHAEKYNVLEFHPREEASEVKESTEEEPKNEELTEVELSEEESTDKIFLGVMEERFMEQELNAATALLELREYRISTLKN